MESWQQIASNYMSCHDWSLVAKALGKTTEELEEARQAEGLSGLASWGQSLQAQEKIDRLNALRRQVQSGKKGALTALEEARAGVRVEDFLPHCCNAPLFYKGGLGPDAVEELLGPFPRDKGCDPEACHHKCMLVYQTLLKATQVQQAIEGEVNMLKHLGIVDLKQGEAGAVDFVPTKWLLMSDDGSDNKVK